MAYRQPRIPEYRESEGAGRYLRALVLFLKDFTMSAWTANNQRKNEIENLRKAMPEMPEIHYPVTSVNGKSGDVELSAEDVGALGAQDTAQSALSAQSAQDAQMLGGSPPSAYAPAARGLPAGGSAGQVLYKVSGGDYSVGWKDLPKAKLLWSNGSPTSYFSTQMVKLDLSAYNTVLMLFQSHISFYGNIWYYWWESVPVGVSGCVNFTNIGDSIGPVTTLRPYNVYTTGVQFYGGAYQWSGNIAYEDSRAVPLQIYAI